MKWESQSVIPIIKSMNVATCSLTSSSMVASSAVLIFVFLLTALSDLLFMSNPHASSKLTSGWEFELTGPSLTPMPQVPVKPGSHLIASSCWRWSWLIVLQCAEWCLSSEDRRESDLKSAKMRAEVCLVLSKIEVQRRRISIFNSTISSRTWASLRDLTIDPHHLGWVHKHGQISSWEWRNRLNSLTKVYSTMSFHNREDQGGSRRATCILYCLSAFLIVSDLLCRALLIWWWSLYPCNTHSGLALE